MKTPLCVLIIEDSADDAALLVRELPDGYQLIAGERRLRAAALAGLREVPVVVHPGTGTDPEEGLELSRKLLNKEPDSNKQIIMITDGRPTAARINGRSSVLVSEGNAVEPTTCVMYDRFSWPASLSPRSF